MRVEVETKGEITRGMSIADWKGQWNKPKNCTVLRKRLGVVGNMCPGLLAWELGKVEDNSGYPRITDRDEFYRVFVRAIARLPRSES